MTCNEQGTKTDTTPTRHASVRVSTTQRRQKTGRGGPERESESKRERGVGAELKKEVEGKREERRKRGGEKGREEPCEGSPSICLNAAACPGGREPERVHSGLNKGCS